MLLVVVAALAIQTVPIPPAPPPAQTPSIVRVAPTAEDSAVPPGLRKPTPRGRPQEWITDDDYPALALRNRQFGPVKFRVDVDARGRPTGCHIIGTSGYSTLDEKVCEMLGRRSEFIPARDVAGQDMPFVYNGTFTWIIPGGPRENPVSGLASEPLYVDVDLKAVPKNYTNPALLRLVFAKDKVKACHVEISSGNPKLDAVACAQTSAQVPPLADVKGWPDSDSRMVSVRFEAMN